MAGADAQRPTRRHVYVTQDYAPDRGGIARMHVELCRRFAPNAMTVSTVDAAGARAFDAGEPYEIHRQPFTMRQAKTLVSQLRWGRWLLRRRFDVLHCGNVRPVGYTVWWVARHRGVPYVVYVYGGDLLRARRGARRNVLKRWTARRIFADAAAVIAISRWNAGLAADVMREVGVVAPPPIAVIPLGTDPVQFAPERATGAVRARFGLGDAPLLLTVARLVPHKGQDVALRALAQLGAEFPDLRYLIVGSGPDDARLRQLAAELGVADRVTFAGALSDGDIADAYASASVYVGLSRVEQEKDAEGFGISFAEAAASGTPCVAGDSGGVPCAVRHGETGVLVPPTDVAAVVDALRALLGDPAKRAAMARAARESAVTYYNWDRVARQTLELVRAVIERRPIPFAGGNA